MGFVSEYSNKLQTGGLQHLLASQIEQEVGRDNFRDYFKFSFVRNPFDKAVSQFHFLAKRQDLREFIGLKQGGSFKEYVRLIQQKKHVQWEEQHKFLVNDQGDIIVDFIGRFEDFENDLRKILAKLGMDSSIRIPHSQKSVHGPYQDYYDDDTVAMASSLYAKDLEYFGYSFAG
jgi:hypothetical protein